MTRAVGMFKCFAWFKKSVNFKEILQLSSEIVQASYFINSLVFSESITQVS